MRSARLEWKDASEKPDEPGYYLIWAGKGISLTTMHPSWWNWKHKNRSKAAEFDGPIVKKWARIGAIHMTDKLRAKRS